MERLFKTIGVVSIVALTLAAVVEASAQSSSVPDHRSRAYNQINKELCSNALNAEKSGWNQNPDYAPYVAEAVKRGLTVDVCRTERWEWEKQAPAELPPPTGSGTSEQGAFLEAALFFITGVDTTESDTVTNYEIRLSRYRIVAYLVSDNACAIRIRTTTQPYTVWQMDFCKITYYQGEGTYGGPVYWWYGYKTALCIHKGWDKNENYTGPMDEQECRPNQFKRPRYQGEPGPDIYTVYNSLIDIDSFLFGTRPRGQRSLDRMMASFKYIQTLLRGKPY